MTRSIIVLSLALALTAPAAPPALAEHHEAEMGAYSRNLAFVAGRILELGEAIPAAAYGWRPAEGVRSVSESIMHIAAANYFFAGRMGTPTPEGIDLQGLEKITDKEEVLTTLAPSIEHLQTAFDAVADTGAEVDLFGRKGTMEDMMQIAIGHVHEHFGQLIAYARSNGVVPPWSQAEGN